MLFQKFNKPVKVVRLFRLYTTLSTDEYTKTAEYPPILDLSQRAERQRKIESWQKQIQNLRTVEEKLMKVNMPRYYGWNCIMLDDKKIPFNSLPLIQHCTRTHLILKNSLPKMYNEANSSVDIVLKDVKANIEDALRFELLAVRRRQGEEPTLTPCELEDSVTTSIIQQINRIILKKLCSTYTHLMDIKIDLDPRHEAFWFVGGINPTDRIRNIRKKQPAQQEFADEPVNRGAQFIGSPTLAIRNKLPISPILSLPAATNPNFHVPSFKYDPRVVGYNSEFRHGTSIPGFWPGDPYDFGLLSYHKRGYILNRIESLGEEDNLEALHGQAILSSYSWLFSQACFQGFSTYNDVTYPFVTQTIVTNGKLWSFYVYQLNTTLIHTDYITNNSKSNICWTTRPLKLYEDIDADGKIIGFNDEVLKMLLHFYINKPEERVGEDMQPYLDKNEKYIANIANDERRIWLERQYKYMMSNRPRHRLGYEFYNWEKMYKIDNKTRPLEARRRPFELDQNPLMRHYDQHHPRYVPKKMRPEGTKRKNQNKWEKTYYP